MSSIKKVEAFQTADGSLHLTLEQALTKQHEINEAKEAAKRMSISSLEKVKEFKTKTKESLIALYKDREWKETGCNCPNQGETGYGCLPHFCTCIFFTEDETDKTPAQWWCDRHTNKYRVNKGCRNCNYTDCSLSCDALRPRS